MCPEGQGIIYRGARLVRYTPSYNRSFFSFFVFDFFFFFFQAEDGIRDTSVTGVQTCALPIYLILRDRDTNADGALDERLYALQDANWNVTALTSSSGDVQERYAYDAYGADRKSVV